MIVVDDPVEVDLTEAERAKLMAWFEGLKPCLKIWRGPSVTIMTVDTARVSDPAGEPRRRAGRRR